LPIFTSEQNEETTSCFSTLNPTYQRSAPCVPLEFRDAFSSLICCTSLATGLYEYYVYIPGWKMPQASWHSCAKL